MDAPVKVACIQAEPVVLDREATVDKLERLTAEAAGEGAQLVAFPEAFVSAYPSSVWAKALAGWAEPGAAETFALLAREAVAVPGEAEARIGAAAKANGVWIVTGVNEVDPERPSTIYNSLLFHAPDGTLAVEHRKLVPTNHERLVWGQGDGGGLRALPDLARPHRRPDLLGELHAARALRALRVGRRDLHRLDRRRRRRLAVDAHPHRPRVARVRDLPLPLPARVLLPGRLPAAPADRGRGDDRPRRLGDPRPRRRLPRRARSTARRGSSMPSSTRRCSGPSGSASTRRATITGPTCSG